MITANVVAFGATAQVAEAKCKCECDDADVDVDEKPVKKYIAE